MATEKISNIDEAEAQINFRYSLSIMLQNDDKAGLAKAKKNHPELYADWEKRNAAMKKSETAAKASAQKNNKK